MPKVEDMPIREAWMMKQVQHDDMQKARDQLLSGFHVIRRQT